MHQDKSKSLIDLLIKEFRVWETLLRLAKEERQALLAEDLSILAYLASQKEHLFGDVRLYQHARQELLKSFLGPHGSGPDYLKCPAMQTLLESFSPEEASCLFHISEGIELLINQLEDLARGNYALADCAMERLWALQTWLQVASQNNSSVLPTEVDAARSPLKTAGHTVHSNA